MDLTDKRAFSSIDEDLVSRIEGSGLSLGVDYQSDRYGEALRFYLLLTHWPEMLGAKHDPLNLFYARYYWFRKFANRYQRDHGSDAGIEQQGFQLLEQAPEAVDWSRLQELDTKAQEDARPS
ncbi:MAG TPA: hypothetical protein VFS60_16705 [Thermoanaerobaculia bacterium]|nr:hypothetical protein [Thermoanaerobaculia bacterium]